MFMLNTIPVLEKMIEKDGLMFRFNMTDTLTRMKVGEEKVFRREFVPPSVVRPIVSRVNSKTNMRFSVQTFDMDNYSVVKRIR